MPNQGNKSNGKSGIVRPKKNATTPSKQKQADKGGKGQGETTSSAKGSAKPNPTTKD